MPVCLIEDKKEIIVWTYVWRNIQLLFIDTHTHTSVHRYRRQQCGHERGLYEYTYIHRGKKGTFERIDRIMLCNQHYLNALLSVYTENQWWCVYVCILHIMCICYLYQFLCSINDSWLIGLVFFEDDISYSPTGASFSFVDRYKFWYENTNVCVYWITTTNQCKKRKKIL